MWSSESLTSGPEEHAPRQAVGRTVCLVESQKLEEPLSQPTEPSHRLRCELGFVSITARGGFKEGLKLHRGS